MWPSHSRKWTSGYLAATSDSNVAYSVLAMTKSWFDASSSKIGVVCAGSNSTFSTYSPVDLVAEGVEDELPAAVVLLRPAVVVDRPDVGEAEAQLIEGLARTRPRSSRPLGRLSPRPPSSPVCVPPPAVVAPPLPASSSSPPQAASTLPPTKTPAAAAAPMCSSPRLLTRRPIGQDETRWLPSSAHDSLPESRRTQSARRATRCARW